MSTRTIVIAALVGLTVGALVLLLGRGDPMSPEEQVKRVLSDMVAAANDRNPGGILSHVSEDFRGDGGLDRDRLRGMLFVEFRRGSWTGVRLYDVDVEFPSTTVADVTARAILARGDGPIPSNVDSWQLDFSLEEQDGKWRVVRGGYRSARR